MRTIHKGNYGGHHLEVEHQIPPQTKEEARRRWSAFNHKPQLTTLLVDEQYGQCAYSEINMAHHGIGCHIEHLEPRSLAPTRTFDYNNLVLSALSSNDLCTMEKNNVFAGHYKLSRYDPDQFISCIDNDSAEHFVYLSDGRVTAKNSLEDIDQQKAEYTIELLNLNSPYLVNLRKRWLDELDQLIDEYLDNELSLIDLASVYLLPRNELLDSFFTANRQRFGRIGDRILKQEAPELS